MKRLQDIRTKLNGKYLPATIAGIGIMFSISIALFVGHIQKEKVAQAENEIVLSKDTWHCFAGVLDDNSEFQCLVYKRKGLDFGAHSSNRQREYNKKQGPSV